jgi:hypothetical protein
MAITMIASRVEKSEQENTERLTLKRYKKEVGIDTQKTQRNFANKKENQPRETLVKLLPEIGLTIYQSNARFHLGLKIVLAQKL